MTEDRGTQDGSGGQATALQAAYPEEFLSGKLTQVDMAGIERELRQLWQSAEAVDQDVERPTVSRACALNLILYSSDEDAETSAGTLLDEISVTHPSRALLAIARPSKEPHLEAWVSARCHLPAPGSTKQICCEQITVRWEGQGVHELPSVVLPLLVSDLPVFLWWRTNNFDRDALNPFLPAVDRLIVDADRWTSPLTLFRGVVAYLGEKDRPRLSDLSWRRLHAWREAIASAFDAAGTGLKVPDLDEIINVNIVYDRHCLSQVALLTAWLASRLSWRPVFAEDISRGGIKLTFARRKRRIEVNWIPQASDRSRTGSVRTVELCWSDRRLLTVALEERGGKQVLIVQSSAGAPPAREIVARGPDMNEPRLVGYELDVFGRDHVFEAAARLVGEFAELYE